MTTCDIGVVHLVRTGNELRLLQRFIQSYRENCPSNSHDLVVLLKGFQKGKELDDTLSVVEGIECKTLMIPDDGYDIASYFLATKHLDHKYLCFLNSYSILQDSQWLEKMYEFASVDGVGAVGATGSWQSHYSASCRWRTAGTRGRPSIKAFPRFLVRRLRASLYLRPDFPPFPNYHLRTNAFMLPREVMRELADAPVRTNWDALRFESGKWGLTSRIRSMDLQVLVIGRDGKAYEPKHWDQSGTYRSSRQANLLVADNRTAEYVNASPEARWMMEDLAWGRRVSVE